MFRLHNRRRAEGGMTLLEMVFSVAIVGIAAAGISGLVLLNGMTSVRMANKVDGLNAARNVVERLGRDIREARNVGDVYGDATPDIFPSSTNLIYASRVPPGGWPAGWTYPYRLSNRCLIIQLPVFYQQAGNWWPSSIMKGEMEDGTPLSPVENVDTVVYQVVEDQAEPGTYELQMCCFPGWVTPAFGDAATPQIRSTINPPQTVLRGITNPQVFQYLEETDPNGTARNGTLDPAPNITSASNVAGVIVNLEILRKDNGSTAPGNVALKSEVYMRNNPRASVQGT